MFFYSSNRSIAMNLFKFCADRVAVAFSLFILSAFSYAVPPDKGVLYDSERSVGVETTRQSLKNANLQLRSDPIMEKQTDGPWLKAGSSLDDKDLLLEGDTRELGRNANPGLRSAPSTPDAEEQTDGLEVHVEAGFPLGDKDLRSEVGDSEDKFQTSTF
jgi:hypothetical protein